MKKYENYKQSGVEVIGGIPVHWEVKKLKYLIKLSSGELTKKIDNGIYDLFGANGVIGKTDKFNIIKKHIIIGRVGSSGAINEANEKSWISDNALIVHLEENISYYRFIYYTLISLNLVRFSTSNAQPLITAGTIKNIKVTLPSFKEQEKIATFLDIKSQQVEEFIKEKEHQIALLEEQKEAIINQAVTKGLDDSVKMKDSGIEWIGDIPEHWEVRKLKYCVSEKLRYGANESAELIDTNYPRYIRITDFGFDGKLREDTFKSLHPDVAKNYLLTEGDILFARSGATVGKTFQFKNYDGKACFAGYLIKATVNEDIMYSDFLFLFTKSSVYIKWKDFIFNKATIENIGADKYNELQLTLPLLDEQKEIVKYVKVELSKVDEVITQIQKEIDLIKEYKISLISEVVTGQIDVR